MKAVIELINGVEGGCICICASGDDGGRRVAGPKPWGGGVVVKKWITTVEDIEDALQSIRNINSSTNNERTSICPECHSDDSDVECGLSFCNACGNSWRHGQTKSVS